MRKNILLYFLKKLLIFAASIFLLSIAVFCISRLSPGDPLVSYYGDQAERMSPQQRELAEERLGLLWRFFSEYCAPGLRTGGPTGSSVEWGR